MALWDVFPLREEFLECRVCVVRATCDQQGPALQQDRRRLFHAFQRLQFGDGGEGLDGLVIEYEQLGKRTQDAAVVRRE